MKFKRVAPRIPENIVEFYESNFKTLNAGVEYAIIAFPFLQSHIAEIAKPFSKNEIDQIKTIMLKHKFNLSFAGKTIIAELYNDKSNQDLFDKIASMDSSHRVLLELWASN